MSSKNTFPKLIGKTFAYLQDGMDTLIEKASKKLQKIGSEKKTQDAPLYKKIFKGIAKGTGDIFSEFYKTYNQLKERKKKNK